MACHSNPIQLTSMAFYEGAIYVFNSNCSWPENPKEKLDVFLQPLIAELKELWEVGV